MDITYDIILKYLVSDDMNYFSNKPNIIQSYNLFNKFKDIFYESFYRYGVYDKDDDNNNISLINSIIYCIDNNYFSKSEDEIKKSISLLISCMYNFFKDNNDDNLIKHYDDIFKNKNYDNPFLLEFICIFLKINIFIFDFKTECISSVYYKDFYNPWRPNIFIAKFDNFWEPIVTQKNSLFNFSDKILRDNILYKDISYHIENLKKFDINDNINEILDLEKLNFEDIISDDNNISDDNISDENIENIEDEGSAFTNKNNLYKNLTKNKLNKMKKAEVIDVLEELEIDYSNIKKPTKADLITLFLDNK